ncbi:DUF1707 domain-containing protein [Kitasatospora sp. NPDC057542]|uniref:DUF1707 SHOCT-like domain-containing protein n=1 Tax=Kitasatospora sp. NPDC057542 TaxID=3346162 RepID=UPI0036ACBE24
MGPLVVAPFRRVGRCSGAWGQEVPMASGSPDGSVDLKMDVHRVRGMIVCRLAGALDAGTLPKAESVLEVTTNHLPRLLCVDLSVTSVLRRARFSEASARAVPRSGADPPSAGQSARALESFHEQPEQLPIRTTPQNQTEPRAGDADREAVAERLREAAGEGRINLGELTERLDLTYAARTYRELDALVSDLGARPSAGNESGDVLVLKPKLGNIRQSGRWTVPRRIVAECRMMHIEIDFTEAVCPHREVTVEAACGAGHIRLITPAGWGVRVDGASTNTGHIVNKAAEVAEPGAPTLTVIGHPRSGLIKIKQRSR